MKLKQKKTTKIEATIEIEDQEYVLHLIRAPKSELKKYKKEIENLNSAFESFEALKGRLETAKKRESILQKKLDIAENTEEMKPLLDAIDEKLIEIEALEAEVKEKGKEPFELEKISEKICRLQIAEESILAAEAYADRFSWTDLNIFLNLFWKTADKKK